MQASATGLGYCINATQRAAATLGVVACAFALTACDDGRSFKNQSQQGQSAKLVVPDTLTPPVQVMPVAGAPANWQLHTRVAEALRQRDIPAGVKMRGSHVYVLRGRVVQLNRTGAQTQVTVKWRLTDGNGAKVGEVTQMAAIPTAKAGAQSKDSSDDVTQAMADAAAESLSPIVPSSRLKTSQQAMTGLPPKRSRREHEKRNPVTAIGKSQKKHTSLGRNLLTPSKNGADGKAATGATPPAKRKTALGRRGAGKSPLSRNLMRRKPLRTPANKRNALPVPGKVRSASPARKDTATRRNPPAPRNAGSGQRAERVSGTTSDAQRSPPATGPKAPTGSMEELFRHHPTRTQREGGGTTRTPRTVPARKSADTPPARATRRRARPTRQIAARRPAPKAKPRRNGKSIRHSRATRAAKPSRKARRYPTARDRIPGRRVYWVQIGSYRSKQVAERHWRRVRRSGGQTLREANRRIMRAKVERRGVFYRVQVGPYVRRNTAYSVCRNLKDRDIACFLYRETEQASLPVTRAGGPRSRPASPVVRRRAVYRSKPSRSKPSRRKYSRHSSNRRKTRRQGDGPRLSPNPRPDKAPVSTSPGLPGLKN